MGAYASWTRTHVSSIRVGDDNAIEGAGISPDGPTILRQRAANEEDTMIKQTWLLPPKQRQGRCRREERVAERRGVGTHVLGDRGSNCCLGEQKRGRIWGDPCSSDKNGAPVVSSRGAIDFDVVQEAAA